ncbi:hypothetical protein GCM10027290_13600 [Micromonospora sonneratiae]
MPILSRVMDRKDRVALLARVRGCVLGLILGDALGATGGTVPKGGPLRATSAGQLACFTVEGIIRASVRYSHRGICHAPSVVWRAYHRWAALQGIHDVTRWKDDGLLNGWLAKVPVLGAPRGTAPATSAALRSGRQGSADSPTGTSVGAHGLTRSLPAAVGPQWGPSPASLTAEVAALTHGPQAIRTAEVAATIVHHLGQHPDLTSAVRQALDGGPSQPDGPIGTALADALETARSRPRRHTELARLAPDERAISALAGAVYVSAAMLDPSSLTETLLFAASAGDNGHTATVAGALLGAAYGVDALPVDLLSRLELSWVADTLARDLVAEQLDGPSGGEYAAADDPHWWSRYPDG